MISQQAWFSRWIERWVSDANGEIARHQAVISELLSLSIATNESDERDLYKSIIEWHEGSIDEILHSHRRKQIHAKHRWDVHMPDLIAN